MKVLITGIGGFVGSHMALYLREKGIEVCGIDSFRHRGDLIRLQDFGGRVLIHDLRVGISNRHTLFDSLDYIINCASGSHVDTSIESPANFIENNVLLILNMLELARVQKGLKGFFQVSTDEVYGPAWHNNHHEEWDPIIPSNPYAASKAAQEAIAISYWRTYGIPIVITNTMNMIGEMQDPEKFLPTIIKKALSNEVVTVHGTTNRPGSRYYLYVRDFCEAIFFLIQNNYPLARYNDNGEAFKPDRFNIVGKTELTNDEVVDKVASVLGRPILTTHVDFHKARPGHDRRYALSSKKLDNLGWSAKTDISDAIKQTVNWYLKNPRWLD